jgi:hypothetical protein
VKQQQCEWEQFIESNDKVKRFARDFHIKWKEREREQDSGETETESVCERQSIAGEAIK